MYSLLAQQDGAAAGGGIVSIIFLPFVFWPMLGFGDAQYQAVAAPAPAAAV